MVEEVLFFPEILTNVLGVLFAILAAFFLQHEIEENKELREALSTEYHILREMINLSLLKKGDDKTLKELRQKILSFIVLYLGKISDSWYAPIRMKLEDPTLLIEKSKETPESKRKKVLIQKADYWKEVLLTTHAKTRTYYELGLPFVIWAMLLLLFFGLQYSFVIKYGIYPNIFLGIFGFIFFTVLMDFHKINVGAYQTTMHHRIEWMYIMILSHDLEENKSLVAKLLATFLITMKFYRRTSHICSQLRNELENTCWEYAKKIKLPRWEKVEELEPEFLEKLRGFNTNQAHRLNDEIELPYYKNLRRIAQFLFMKLPGMSNRTKKSLIKNSSMKININWLMLLVIYIVIFTALYNQIRVIGIIIGNSLLLVIFLLAFGIFTLKDREYSKELGNILSDAKKIRQMFGNEYRDYYLDPKEFKENIKAVIQRLCVKGCEKESKKTCAMIDIIKEIKDEFGLEISIRRFGPEDSII